MFNTAARPCISYLENNNVHLSPVTPCHKTQSPSEHLSRDTVTSDLTL